jgi:uncharacterized spore protein YtfJ
MQNALEAVSQARDAITVKRVFGDPYEKDGVTLLPAAAVGGGAGGGGGQDAQGGGGGGSGFGVGARPVGAFVIRDGDVLWQPAVDVTRIVLGGQLVAIAAMLTIRTIVKARTAKKVAVTRIEAKRARARG